MLDMVNPSFSVAHVMLSRGATCASRCSKMGHSTTHCGLKAIINPKRWSIPKGMKDCCRCTYSKRALLQISSHFLRKRTDEFDAGNARRGLPANLVTFATDLCYIFLNACHACHGRLSCRGTSMCSFSVPNALEDHPMPSKMRLRNSRATEDGDKAIRAHESHSFEGHWRHVSVSRYNSPDLTRMVWERGPLHLCWVCTVLVEIVPRYGMSIFHTLWESHHVPSVIHVFRGYQEGGCHRRPGRLRRRCRYIYL